MPGTLGDPVETGYIKSLSHPGTNFTGLLFAPLETLIPKRLELLKELVPTAPVAVLWSPPYPGWEISEAAARQHGWKLLSFPIRDIGEIDEILRKAAKARVGAILPLSGLVGCLHHIENCF
jgi:putative ABC transport system substrate-binding protein